MKISASFIVANLALLIHLYPVASLPAHAQTPAGKVVVSDYSSCGIFGSGVRCWGSNERWALGRNPAEIVSSSNALTVPGLESGVTDISGSWSYTWCAVQNGGGKCWSAGEPVVIGGIENVTAVAAGRDSACWITAENRVKCSYIPFADAYGTFDNTALVVDVPLSGRVTRLRSDANSYSALVVKGRSSTSIYQWQFGRNTSMVPTKLNGVPSRVSDFVLGRGAFCTVSGLKKDLKCGSIITPERGRPRGRLKPVKQAWNGSQRLSRSKVVRGVSQIDGNRGLTVAALADGTVGFWGKIYLPNDKYLADQTSACDKPMRCVSKFNKVGSVSVGGRLPGAGLRDWLPTVCINADDTAKCLGYSILGMAGQPWTPPWPNDIVPDFTDVSL